jgi:hypothetical protein
MRKSGYGVLGGACALAIGAAAAQRAEPAEKLSPAAVEAAREALVGQWQLNTSLSDDPRAKMREGAGGSGGDRGGGGRGWGGGGGGGGWGGGRGGSGGMGRGGGGWGGGRGGGMGRGGGGGGGGESTPSARRALLFPAPQITITNLTPEVTVLSPDGTMRHLHADNKGYKDETTGTEVKARWDDSKLVVDTKSERGSVKETWTAASDPRRLEVLLEVQRPFGDAVKIKRVYDPVDPNAPKKETPPATPPAGSEPPPTPASPPATPGSQPPPDRPGL